MTAGFLLEISGYDAMDMFYGKRTKHDICIEQRVIYYAVLNHNQPIKIFMDVLWRRFASIIALTQYLISLNCKRRLKIFIAMWMISNKIYFASIVRKIWHQILEIDRKEVIYPTVPASFHSRWVLVVG